MPRNQSMGVSEAQAKSLDLIAAGYTVKDAMAEVGRSVKTFRNWRADKESGFGAKVDEVRARRKRAMAAGRDEDVSNLDFASWRKRFLDRDTYMHQQQWIDVLEGRELTDLHPAISYTKGNPNRVIINTPPYHAKSTTITMEYVTYKLCMNPNYRVIIVSKTQQQAKKYLYTVRQFLTSPVYAELQAAYGPADGFKGTEGAWTSNMIYLASRESSEKDPSVEALGIGGQIYGSRADLIILDDAVTMQNCREFEKQFNWINQEVSSRLKHGKLILVGTRVDTTDLYSTLLDGDQYISGKSPWTYMGQPCVLEFAEDPKDWVTLWPRSSRSLDENSEVPPDEDGTYAAWDGPALSEVRASNSPSKWALVYMQQHVAEDATFHPVCVKGSTDGMRKPGLLIAGAMGHPREGMEGMHVIGSIDPAGTGLACILLYAVHRTTKMRYVLDCIMKTNTIPSWYAEQIERLTPLYGVSEWVIESNAYASWLIHDERIRGYVQGRGVRLTPTFTGRNKQDPDFGVASMSSLFGSMERTHEGAGPLRHKDDNIISLPATTSEGIKALCEQLVTWKPGKLGRELRQDGPMALWFAETVARRLLGFGPDARQSNFARNPYAARRDLAQRRVIPSGY